MKEITEAIDAYLLTLYPNDFKFWGLAEIINKSKEKLPVTVNGREKVCIDERYDCCVWHREISATSEEDEEDSWGLNLTKNYSVTLRTIVAYKIELGEEFKYEFMNAFPQDLSLTGYDEVYIVQGSVNLDHFAVVTEEEIHTQEEKARLCWNIFSFENTIEFSLCTETSP